MTRASNGRNYDPLGPLASDGEHLASSFEGAFEEDRQMPRDPFAPPLLAIPGEHRVSTLVKREHRSLVTLMNGVRFVVARLNKDPHRLPEFALLRAVLLYLETYAFKYQDPKEERFVFARLRERAPEWASLVDRMCGDHTSDKEQLARIRAMLDAWMSGAEDGAQRFTSEFERFVDAQWRHMGAEEHLLLPAAERHLLPEDWLRAEEEFQQNATPALEIGVEESFASFSIRLVNLVPELLQVRNAVEDLCLQATDTKLRPLKDSQ